MSAPLTERDFLQLLDEGLLKAARDLGLPASKHSHSKSDGYGPEGHNFSRPEEENGCIEVGFDYLHFSVRHAEIKGNEGRLMLVILEAEARVVDPKKNAAPVRHLVTGMGPTAREAIANATSDWVHGVLPALCRLFDANVGTTLGTLRINSYTEGDEEATEWEGFVGALQFWGDTEKLEKVITAGLPYGLMNQTLTNYLNDKNLHWVKVSGVRSPDGSTEFTVAIDGEIDPQGCAEATHKFDWSPFPNPCYFRQFFIVRPKCSVPIESVPGLAEALQQHQMDTTPREQRPPQLAPPTPPPTPQAAPTPAPAPQKRSWFPFKRKTH